MHRFLFSLILATLIGCAPVPRDAVQTSRASGQLEPALPAMKMFSEHAAARPTRSNAAMARDFLDLSFQLESGKSLPVMTRFEGPITIRVVTPAPPTLIPDLDRLIARLRNEAGIDITRVTGNQPASITIQPIGRGELQRMVPQAACFVSPRISSWSEFKASRRSAAADWTTLTTRDRMAVFLPADVSPQEIRDCLHEEIAQALGPLNDLYRLPDSVFNDDNFHAVLTGFDMLMLRVTYSADLHSGMSQPEVASRLPGILARLNPGAGPQGIGPATATPRNWIDAMETALGSRTQPSRRRSAARQAVAIAQSQHWNDSRRAFSLYALGRLALASDPDLALASFLQADAIYSSRPETSVQAAYIAVQLAAYALTTGNTDAVLTITNASIPAAAAGQNATLLSQLMMIKAEALDIANRHDEARVVRLDSLGWARYGFGSEAAVRSHAAEIASLSPRVKEARAR